MVQSIRFTGLASGMDTQSIVDSMMRAQRLPLDRLNQQKQTVEWQRDQFREMNTLLKEFDEFIFGGIYKQSNLMKKSVTNSNSGLVTATANANAGDVSYKIENVTLAKAARRESTEEISSGGFDPSKSLFSQKDKLSNLTWEQGSGDTTKPENNYLSFSIKTYDENGKEVKKDFKFSGDKTLNEMFGEINKSSAGVNIFYDSHKDVVVAESKVTGEVEGGGTAINFEGASASFFTDTLKLSTETAGENAKFTINGLETERRTNTFTMNDVTFTLNKNSAADEAPATISLKTDTDAIMKTITDFVDKYNELIDKVNGKLTEERFSSFKPLTTEEKAAMSEKEIEDWEEKAKSGLLRRDTLLSNGLNQLRLATYTEVKPGSNPLVDEKYNQISEIGITTTKNYMDRGKLEINEDKLRAAIEDNPEAVYQLFMSDGPTSNEKGIARRLRDSVSETLQKVEEKAGNTFKTEHNYTMGKNILQINENIQRLEDRLRMTEQRLWNQFNAMEKAMQEMNNQSSQLMAQLGMGQQ